MNDLYTEGHQHLNFVDLSQSEEGKAEKKRQAENYRKIAMRNVYAVNKERKNEMDQRKRPATTARR